MVTNLNSTKYYRVKKEFPHPWPLGLLRRTTECHQMTYWMSSNDYWMSSDDCIFLSRVYIDTWCVCEIPPLTCKLIEDWEFFLLCTLLYAQCLEQSLALIFNKYSLHQYVISHFIFNVLLHLALLHSFSWLNSNPLYRYIMIYLIDFLLMDTQVVSSLLLPKSLQWMCFYI